MSMRVNAKCAHQVHPPPRLLARARVPPGWVVKRRAAPGRPPGARMRFLMLAIPVSAVGPAAIFVDGACSGDVDSCGALPTR